MKSTDVSGKYYNSKEGVALISNRRWAIKNEDGLYASFNKEASVWDSKNTVDFIIEDMNENGGDWSTMNLVAFHDTLEQAVEARKTWK